MVSVISGFICLLILNSAVFGQSHSEESYFDERIPTEYFSRSNLSDCHRRFHDRLLNEQCLIFGGVRANVTEFPHMAVIGWTTATGGSHGTQIAWKCGGSLITKRYVVTAAHCAVDEDNKAPSVVRLGDVNLASNEDDEYAQQFDIVRFVRHPQHRFSSKYYDIALIELAEAVKLTTGVCPACVWYESNLPYLNFNVAGFGATGYAEQSSPHLLKAYLTMEKRENCTEQFEATRGLLNGILEQQICASNIAMDTCHGDSGGPLQMTLFSYNQQIPTLVGVTSFGRSCGFGSLGVYQKIQPHISWMESIVDETLDPVECVKKYESFRYPYQLEPECQIANPYINRVELHWDQYQHSPECAGTLIDYNTVITSADCTKKLAGKDPSYVSILKEKVLVSEIQRHPNYIPGSPKDNIALIRLKAYLKTNERIAPACPSSKSFNYRLGSIKLSQNVSTNRMVQHFLPVQHKCSDKLLLNSNFNKITGENIDCWDTDYRLVPGLCQIDEGGPLLDRSHTTIQGINIMPGICGSHNPLAVLKLDSYLSWIESFVLDRSVTPEPPIMFPNDDNVDLFFKPCCTREGTDGKCLDHWACGAEITKHKLHQTSVTMCGFDGDFGLICCPNDSIGSPLTIPLPVLIALKPVIKLELNDTGENA